MRGRHAAALLIVAVILAGCGGEDFANEPRPPSAIDISTRVDNDGVVVAPQRVGAGLAVVTISNQSDDDVRLRFVGPSQERTAQIDAGGVGSARIALEEGEYRVESDVPTIADASLAVGPERPSAKNELLLP